MSRSKELFEHTEMIPQLDVDFPMKRKAISTYAERLTSEIDNFQDPLEALARVKFLQKVLKECEGKLQEMAQQELSRHGGKYVILDGVKYELKTNGTRYDYSHDSKWQQLKSALDEHQKLMRSIKKPVADTETGELIEPARKKEGVENINVTFK